MAAVTALPFTECFGTLDVGSLAVTLRAQMQEVQGGDMKRAEAMLYGQAQALQAIFAHMARRSAKQEYMKNVEAFMRFALKAQSQSRATLETLAAIKNPPVVFARQANINNGGQQQVNNGTVPQGADSAQARARGRRRWGA